MAGTNYILQFAGSCNPPQIQTDAEYASDPMRTAGWQPGIVRQEFLNKVDRQGNCISAGLAQFMADNQDLDITDDLDPAAIAAIFIAALSGTDLTTQPQFDDSQKPATTEFVQRALGNLASSVVYGVNTNLTGADVGKVVLPSSGGLGFGLPLVAGMPDGAQIRFNGNTHGCVVSRQGSDVIRNGTAGDVSTITVLEYDVVEFTVENGVWRVSGGNEQLNTSTQFEQSLLFAAGYKKLPGGLILQWGIHSTTSPSGSIVTFPIEFPTACLNVSTSDHGNGCFSTSAYSYTTTGFTGRGHDPVAGAFANVDLAWRAIGY